MRGVRPDSRADAGVRSVTSAQPRRLIVEADGGARGNPGPAGYGAVVRDATTREVLAERSGYLRIATNNVAEYHGLIAGLEAAAEIDPSAFVDVRLDSQLVVKQMTGEWQIKHPHLQPLADRAAQLAAAFGSGRVTFTWVRREANAHADRLVNAAIDAGYGPRGGATPVASGTPTRDASAGGARELLAPSGRDGRGAGPAGGVVGADEVRPIPNRVAGWMPAPPATTLLLVRHGVTSFTLEKRFSGVGDPPLVDQGRWQAKLLAQRLAGRGGIDVVVSSPRQRCRQTAELIADVLQQPVLLDDDLREVDFGRWEGLTFAAVQQRWPRELELWLADTSISPPGGESYDELRLRITAAAQRLANRHRGKTVLVVTHSRPIAMFIANALSAPVAAIYRVQIDPASMSEIDYYADGVTVVRTVNDTAHLAAH